MKYCKVKIAYLFFFLFTSQDKVKVIYDGCDISPWTVAETPQNLPQKPFFTIGTITDKKNFYVLSAILLKNDFNLIIAGINQNPE